MTDSADRLFTRGRGETEARRLVWYGSHETRLHIPRDRTLEFVGTAEISRPLETQRTVVTAHGGHDHSHPHTHGHESTTRLPASYTPEKKLTDAERREKRNDGLKWAGVAAIVFALDAVFHIAVPGPVDDVLIHGLALIIASKSARGFNAYWRGYELEGKNVDLKALGGELRELWKRRESVTGFIRAAIPVVEKHVPKQGLREVYRGEGYPVSSVTYATENLVYGHYREDSGPMKGWRKRLMSAGVLAATAVTHTLGNALRWGIMKNFHDVGDAVHAALKPWIKNDNVRFWVGAPLVLVGGIIMAIPYAAAGLVEGTWRYLWEVGEGLLSWNKKPPIKAKQPQEAGLPS